MNMIMNVLISTLKDILSDNNNWNGIDFEEMG